MPPPPPPAHSALSHRSPFVTYTGSWLATAGHHSWVPEPSEDGSFTFAFDGTDFAVYGAWDADTAAWVNIDGESTWWHADGPPSTLSAPVEGDMGQLLYRDTVEPGFHKVSFNMAGGRMDLVKVVVGDGPIGVDSSFAWWHLSLAVSATLLVALRILQTRKRAPTPVPTPDAASEKV